MMRLFSRSEGIAICVILLLIVTLSYHNFTLSLRRSRDFQRQADLSDITHALDRFQADFGFFPPSDDEGRIVACSDESPEILESRIAGLKSFDYAAYLALNLRACEWGEDPLEDVLIPSDPAYRERLPQDPKTDEGRRYVYLSIGRRYQLYTSFEGPEYADERVVSRNLLCGTDICEYGKSYAETPLDESLEDYEDRLRHELQGIPYTKN